MTDKPVAQATSPHAFPRRRLFQGATLVTGAAIAGMISPYSADASSSGGVSLARLLKQLDLATPEAIGAYTPEALSPAEMTALKAAIDRIIPTDDLGPGASEAGVHVFIDQALHGNSAALLPLFQAGLAALDAAAGAGGFAALDAAKQDDLMKQAEAGTLANAPAAFFSLVLYNTRSGMFSDPVHGGNVNFAGWDLMQYPGIKLVWSEADQQIDAVVKPMHVSVTQFRGGNS